MRNNIFDLISNKKTDLLEEYLRIHRLFEIEKVDGPYTLKETIQRKYFLSWKYRKRFLFIDELMASLDLDYDSMNKSITIDKLLNYIELILNLMILINRYISTSVDKIGNILINNINDLLEDLNYEKIHQQDLGRVIITEKNKLTTAVAEIRPEIIKPVIEYRRFSLKGDIEAKRNILKTLANEVEPLRKTFKGTTYSPFVEDTFYFLNSLNIRHNNIEGSKAQPIVAKMSDDELEEWYDRTYDMILGVFVLEKYLKDKNKIDTLKNNLK